jgi:hypothetical protein
MKKASNDKLTTTDQQKVPECFFIFVGIAVDELTKRYSSYNFLWYVVNK